MDNLRRVATLGKLIFYAFSVALGLLAGLYVTGRFLRGSITFEGIEASKLSAQQMTEMVLRNPNAMQQTTSLVLDGTVILTAAGAWLYWLVFICTILIFVLAGHLFIRLRLRKR